MRNSLKARKVWDAVVVERNKRAFVSHLVAVVRGAENGYQAPVVVDFVPLVLHFVRPHDELQIVIRQKLLCHVRPERHADAAVRRVPPRQSPGVAPQPLAEQPAFGWFREPVDFPQLRDRHAVAREKTAVHDEHLLRKHRAQG